MNIKEVKFLLDILVLCVRLEFPWPFKRELMIHEGRESTAWQNLNKDARF